MENKENNIKTKKVVKKKKKEVSLFTILFVVALIVLVAFLCTVVNWIVQTLKYKTYTDKMYEYGYNELYSNNKATSIQKVSNMDMIKVIIGSLKNTTNVKYAGIVTKTDNMTDDDVWYETAKVLDLTKISKDDLDKKVRTIDSVIFMIKTIEKTLNITIDEEALNMSEKTLKGFSSEDVKYIAKAVNIGVLANNDKELSNSKLIKGELNKLVVEIVNKYAITYYKTTSVDENGKVIKNNVAFVTSKEELPNNSKEYPYVINTIDKSLYELDFKVENEKNFKDPKEVYSKMSKLYGQIDEIVTRYFDGILNVDYKTINEKEFRDTLNSYVIYRLTLDDVEAYVKYVKDNKITLEGSAEPLLPIIYDSGEGYIVRTKITFKIVNSNTDTNILFGDLGNNVQYKDKEFVMYIDVPMGITLNSNSLLVNTSCIAKHMIKENNNVLVK